MIIIDNTIVSDNLVEKQFICDLNACKGECCIAGVSGAPLDVEETKILEDIYDKVKPYLTAKGIKAIEKQGKHLIDGDGDHVTPLVNGKDECAYTIFEKGIAMCGIEKAYKEGKIDYRKPISCHLYPVRIKKYKTYDAVNYEKWDVCSAACVLGKKEGVYVFEFVREALISKYGEEWYKQLKGAAEFKQQQQPL